MHDASMPLPGNMTIEEQQEAFRNSPEFEMHWRNALMNILGEGLHLYQPDPKGGPSKHYQMGFVGNGRRFHFIVTSVEDNVIPFPVPPKK